jgi:hypothetical protein
LNDDPADGADDGIDKPTRTHVMKRFLRPSVAALPSPSQDRERRPTPSAPRALFTYRDPCWRGALAVVRCWRARSTTDGARLQDSSPRQPEAPGTAPSCAPRHPGSYYIGGTMYLAGRLTKNEELADLGWHGTEALIVGELVAVVIKGTMGRQRPYVEPRNSNSYQLFRGFGGSDKFRSFPSGHSTSAFAAAAAVTSETSRFWPEGTWIVGPISTPGAALTGISRMYNNRHWASDVLVGAGIGTFAGLKVVRYHHTHPGNRLDKWMLAGSIAPADDGGHTLRLSIVPAPAWLTSNPARR